MSSAQERPGGTAGTTGPTDSSAGTGDMAGRGAATGAGTPGYERAGAHRAAEAREADEYEGAGLIVARAGFTFLAAVLMIFSGLVTFFYPGLTALVLVYIIAVWALITGALELYAAYRLRRVVRNEVWLILGGIASLLFGLALLVAPGAGAIALVWLIAVYAVIFGVLLIGLGVRLRGMTEGRRHAMGMA